MCGILGILRRTPGSPDDQARLESALAPLRHRGPDSQGCYADARISLAHARLSILDLSPAGAQPMAWDSGRLVVVYNGEIYNYLELRQELAAKGTIFRSTSDTEVLLAAWAAWGPECLRHFQGAFAFALWDLRRQELFLARDRTGEKPLCYWQDDQQLIFASELKALLPLLPHRPQLDAQAVDLYLHYQYVPEPRTPLQDVHKLPPAHLARISTADWHVKPRRWWSLEDLPAIPCASHAQAAALVAEELETAVRLCLRSDVPVAVALSGGIDSGAIAALAARHHAGAMHAFSIGYPGRPEYDERHQAQELAQRLGMHFHEVELPVERFTEFFPRLAGILDEPIADPAAFAHYTVPLAAREAGIKVLLGGLGGDELFWGYGWLRQAAELNSRLGWVRRLPTALRNLLRSARLQGLGARLPAPVATVLADMQRMAEPRTPANQLVCMTLTPDFMDAFSFRTQCYGPAMAHLGLESPFAATAYGPCPSGGEGRRILRQLFETWLASNCLSLGDRVSMAVGVEQRLPFLDARLIELVMGLRRSLPDLPLGHKGWLKAAVRPLLGDDIVDRPKRGFQPPVWDWLSGVVDAYGETLRDGRLAAAGMLRPQGLDDLLTRRRHEAPALIYAYKLVLLETWHRQLLPEAA